MNAPFTDRFWRCDRCGKVRLWEERPTTITIQPPPQAGGSVDALTVCPACLRELNDEAHARGGLWSR